jgi:hypothetical protein
LLRWDQTDLAAASGVSLPTVKRMEKQFGPLKAHGPTLQALLRALEDAGIQLIHESEEGGIGVRLRHPGHRASGTDPRPVQLPKEWRDETLFPDKGKQSI